MTTVPIAGRLFYDPNCGPCTFFARVSRWATRSRLTVLPDDGEGATNALADLDDESRYAFAHLMDGRGRTSGASIMRPLVGLVLGSTGVRVVAGFPPMDYGLRWNYNCLWNYRRTRGCAIPGGAHSS